MRLILALAAHYKPQSVRHHEASTDYQNVGQPSKQNEGKKILVLQKERRKVR